MVIQGTRFAPRLTHYLHQQMLGASLLVSFIVSLFSSLFDLSPFCLSENVVRRQTLLARLIFEVCPKPGCILLRLFRAHCSFSFTRLERRRPAPNAGAATTLRTRSHVLPSRGEASIQPLHEPVLLISEDGGQWISMKWSNEPPR